MKVHALCKFTGNDVLKVCFLSPNDCMSLKSRIPLWAILLGKLLFLLPRGSLSLYILRSIAERCCRKACVSIVWQLCFCIRCPDAIQRIHIGSKDLLLQRER